MRHPRKCRTYHQLGKCKFNECAYFHSPDENTAKLEKLEKDVVEVKEIVGQLSKSCEELHKELANVSNKTNSIDNIEKAKSTDDDASHPVNCPSKKECCEIKHAKTTKLNRKHKVTKKIKTKKTGTNELYECNQCGYSCSKEITLNKHTNTKHKQEDFKCEKCSNIFFSKNMLYLHLEEEHQDGQVQIE